MKKYLPYVRVHIEGGYLDVYDSSYQEYDTLKEAFDIAETIRIDMLMVDEHCDPTMFVKERTVTE